MEEIGYSGTSYNVPDWIRNALTKFEEKNDTQVTVVCKSGEPQLERDQSLTGLVIYDFSFPGSEPDISEISYVSYLNSTGISTPFNPVSIEEGYVLYSKASDQIYSEEYLTDGTRWPICTVSENVVWTHIPLLGFGLKRVGGEAFERSVIQSLLKANDQEHWDSVRKNLEANTEKEFAKFISKQLSSNVERLKSELEAFKRNRDDAVRDLYSSDTALVNKARELEYYTKLNGQESDHYISQLQTLKTSPRIKSVLFRFGGNLEVTTDKLYLYSPDNQTRAYLGMFRITMKNMSEISMRNLDNSKGGRSHPHVERTHPCLGQAEVTMSQLLAKGEIVALFNYIFQYLETFNPKDDYGKYFTYWFGDEEDNPTVEVRQSDGKFYPKFPKEEEIKDEELVDEILNSDDQRDLNRAEVVE